MEYYLQPPINDCEGFSEWTHLFQKNSLFVVHIPNFLFAISQKITM
jgi:hypothetical protein